MHALERKRWSREAPMRETRESIIDELQRLGVNAHQMLVHRPTDKELVDVRNGLMRLRRK